MNVVFLFLCHRRFPTDIAPVRAVIVAHEEPGFTRQGKHLLDAVIQHTGITAGKIGPG